MIIYDIEIAKCIQGHKDVKEEEYDYCNGWDDHEGMGISCIALHEFCNGRYRLFMADNFHIFSMLVEHTIAANEPIVGFNNINFDNRVVCANGLYSSPDEMEAYSYDILQEIWMAVTGSTEYQRDFDWRVHAGYGLDATVKANLPGMIGKSGSGATAPKDFQMGNYGKLIDYCLTDVWLTVNLIYYLKTTGGKLRSPKNGRVLQLRLPKEVVR